MNSHLRGLRRIATAATLALALLITTAVFAGSALATNVHLRIEGSAGTVFNGNVNTGPRAVNTTANSNCSSDGGSATATTATPATALADWAEAQSPQVAYNTRYGGTFLCQVGSDIGGSSAYWLLKINNLAVPPPAGYVTAGDELHEGDYVEFYWTDDFAKKTLDIVMPSVATVGVATSGTVNKWDGSDDSHVGADGASISGGSASATADANGKFSIVFPAVGTYVVNALQGTAIRGSAIVNVGTTPVSPIVRINRFVKCRTAYKKSSRKYRRCIRIVRAKQLAEKKTKR